MITLPCASHFLLIVTSIYPQQTRIHNSLSFIHVFLCVILCFNRKFLPIPWSRPTFKLATMLLLTGGVSINHRSAISRNISFATTYVRSVRGRIASRRRCDVNSRAAEIGVVVTWRSRVAENKLRDACQQLVPIYLSHCPRKHPWSTAVLCPTHTLI